MFSIYRNLSAEMARKKIMTKDIADALNISNAAASKKLNKPDGLKLMECKLIQEKFFKDSPLDYLFQTDTEQSSRESA